MRIVVAAPVAIMSLATLSALAQPSPDSNADVEQIVVTGSRTPLAIDRLGSATTIITRDEIEARQSRYVTDLLRAVPGFSISQTGVTGSQTQVRVRGAEANHVLVLIDGVRANDPATGDEFRWEHLSSANIERIEIVRGAQSALWGSDAIAAVVQIITRDDAGAASLDGYVEAGAEDTTNVGVNGGLGAAGWTVRGGAEQLATDGSNISRLGDERDGSELRTASLALRWHRTQAFSLDVGVRAVDADSQFDAVDFFITGLPTDGDVGTKSTMRTAHLGALWTPNDRRVQHRLRTTFYDSGHENFTDHVQDSSAASDRVAVTWQSDLSVGENLLSLGLEHERATYRQRGTIAFGNPNQDRAFDATSAIVEFQWLASERLTWLAGARFENNSDFEDVATGRVSLAYRLTDHARLRSSLGTAQKNPTFTERFGYFPDQFIGNPGLEPEASSSFDVGVDFDLADGALELQTTLFLQDLRNEIDGFVLDPNSFLATAMNRDGRSERRGLELGLRWSAGERLGLGASYTFTETNEQDDAGRSRPELRRPRHAGAVSIDYRTAEGRLRATLAADYGGSRADEFFPPFPAASQIVTLHDYWLLDANVQRAITPSITLFVRASNLLDEDYEQVFGYRAPGRALYLGVRTNLRR